MSNLSSVEQKVQTIFRELLPQKNLDFLDPASVPKEMMKQISKVITKTEHDPDGCTNSEEIAFHLSDWGSDAAFIVALHLFPERFTDKEIQEGVLSFLTHVPYHVAEAKKLSTG